MDIILHIGAHKTATTHLQIGLGRARDALAGQGIAVFAPQQLRGAAMDLALALEGDTDLVSRVTQGLAAAAGLPVPPAPADGQPRGASDQSPAPKTPAIQPPATAQLEIAPHIDAPAVPARRLVLSEENILGTSHDPELMWTGRFYPRAGVILPRLLRLLPPGRVQVALAVRDPATFLVSAWSQRLLSGQPTTFERFLDALDPALLRWSDLVWRIGQALPGVPMTVWPYEAWPGVAPAVLEVLLGPDAPAVALDEWPAHPGLSAPAVAAVLAQAEQLSALPRAQAAARIKALRDACPKADGHPPAAPLDARALARSAEAYAADLRRIAAMPQVRLLSQG
jgi:hypothetical protein